MRRILASVALLALGCGGSSTTAPQDVVPALGVYQHSANDDGRAYSGTLTLTYASRDSIAGVWNVPGYSPTALLGGRYSWSAYYSIKAARPDAFGGVTFSLTPNGDAFTCEGQVLVLTPGETVTHQVPCTMTR